MEDIQKLTIRQFLELVNSNRNFWRGYCELIILPNGFICPLNGSHETMLTKIYADKMNMSYEEAVKLSGNDNNLGWSLGSIAIEKYNCIAVWYNNITANKITKRQKIVIKALVDNGLISSEYNMNRTNEYSNYLYQCKLRGVEPTL